MLAQLMCLPNSRHSSIQSGSDGSHTQQGLVISGSQKLSSHGAYCTRREVPAMHNCGRQASRIAFVAVVAVELAGVLTPPGCLQMCKQTQFLGVSKNAMICLAAEVSSSVWFMLHTDIARQQVHGSCLQRTIPQMFSSTENASTTCDCSLSIHASQPCGAFCTCAHCGD